MNEGYKIDLSIKEKMLENHIIIQCQSQSVGNKVISKLDDLTNSHTSLVVKQEDDYIIIKKSEIIFAEVYHKELSIYTNHEEIKTSKSLSSLYHSLAEDTFVKISKSSLVNIHSIRRVTPSFSGNLLVHLSNNMKVSISRRYVSHLKEKLGL